MVTEGGYLWARSYLTLAADWYARCGNEERAADMTLALALSWETETDQRIEADERSGHLVAGNFLESAIQTLRKIPNDQREARGVDAHIARLLKRLAESGKSAVKGMTRFSTGSIDISDLVADSEQRVSGKKALEALLTFAHLAPSVKVEKLADDARRLMKEHPLSSLFASTHYGPDGRVVAKTPSGDFSGESGEFSAQLAAKMLRHFMLHTEVTCSGQIYPALLVIRQEHHLTRADLEQLLAQSPIIPPGRVEQFARGLWAGFEHDFATAIYLLAPQIEHLVRWHLKQAGAKTTTLDADGIENEIGLSSLVDSPSIDQVFGEDLLFELRALFCNPLGPNFRNQVAHGLLSQGECSSSPAIFAWWWILSLVLRSWLNELQQQLAPPAQADSADSAERQDDK